MYYNHPLLLVLKIPVNIVSALFDDVKTLGTSVTICKRLDPRYKIKDSDKNRGNISLSQTTCSCDLLESPRIWRYVSYHDTGATIQYIAILKATQYIELFF